MCVPKLACDLPDTDIMGVKTSISCPDILGIIVGVVIGGAALIFILLICCCCCCTCCCCYKCCRGQKDSETSQVQNVEMAKPQGGYPQGGFPQGGYAQMGGAPMGGMGMTTTTSTSQH